MDQFAFIPVDDFRVRLPVPLYPYVGKQTVEVRHVSEVASGMGGWLALDQISEPFGGAFAERNPLNVPGAVYGAETDTCEAGLVEAPKNVILDGTGHEFVFKQPSNREELRDVLSAAICDPFNGYGANGDSGWRLSLLREWWSNRGDMLQQAGVLRGEPSQIIQWRDGLLGGLLKYLRLYAFYLENRRVRRDGELLPEI